MADDVYGPSVSSIALTKTSCPSGGIGRRVRFRCVCPHGRGGSSPLSGTKPCNEIYSLQGFLFLL